MRRMNVADAARLAGISRATLNRHITKGTDAADRPTSQTG